MGLVPVAAAVETLRCADKPLIIAGNGVRVGLAECQLERLSQATGIPVVTSPAGKGVFDESSPLSCGVYGAYGNPLANRVVGQSDVILAIGTKLSASDTVAVHPDLINTARQKIIQVDIEPRNASWSFPTAQMIIANAATALDAMLSNWSAGARPNWVRNVNLPRTVDLPRSAENAPAVFPHEIIEMMQDTLPAQTIYTCDAGENRIFMLHFLRSRGTGRFIQPAGAGPMGYAIPSALARKPLTPENPVVAFCGDGGFSMTMNGMITAVEAGLPIICVVMNNDALGWSQHSRGPFATQFSRIDYASIGCGMGCRGIRASGLGHVKESLREAIRIAQDERRPVVIDIETSMEVSFARLAFAETKKLSLGAQQAET